MAVPKLRFKEFDGRWKNTSFQSLFTFKNGINASKEQYGSGTKFINVLDIINNPNGITYDSIIGSVQVFQKDIDKNLVNYGDVVFQRSSETREEVGQSNVYLSKEPVVFGGFVIRGFARVSYDPLFMNGLLKTDKVRDQITQLSGGSTRFNIGQDSLNKVSVFLPLKEEQTKIASFLSAVDEKISQLTQKHALLSQYKQGMMQKLFSQQIRFKADDGREFGEWEEKLLSEIGSFKNGLNKDKESFGFGSPFINLMDVFGKKVVQIDNLGLVEANQKDLENYDLKKGDVLFIRSSVKAEGVGQTALVIDDLPNTVYSGFLIRFRDNYGLDLGFKKYCFMNNDFRLRLLAKSTTSANTNINQESLSALTLNIPCLEEQSKIANFLSAIDQKIEVVAQQIEQAKQWKKGLLQQMFV